MSLYIRSVSAIVEQSSDFLTHHEYSLKSEVKDRTSIVSKATQTALEPQILQSNHIFNVESLVSLQLKLIHSNFIHLMNIDDRVWPRITLAMGVLSLGTPYHEYS